MTLTHTSNARVQLIPTRRPPCSPANQIPPTLDEVNPAAEGLQGAPAVLNTGEPILPPDQVIPEAHPGPAPVAGEPEGPAQPGVMRSLLGFEDIEFENNDKES